MTIGDPTKRKAALRPPIDPESLDPTEEIGVGSLRVRERRVNLTPDGRLTTGRLAGLTMAGAIWALSWPVMVESFLNSFVGLTDTTLAAQIGEAETTAIGAASYIMWFIGLIIMAIGVGATALISRSMGRGRVAIANTVLAQVVILSLVAGIATGLLIAAMGEPVSRMLSLSSEAERAFDQYIFIIAAGVPFASMLFSLIACARGAGDSIRPLWAMIIRNIVNLLVSWSLSGVDIYGIANPFPFDLGVRGIAFGTVMGDLVGAMIVLSMAIRGTWGIRLRRKRLHPHWHTMRRLVRLGLPNFFETFGMWVGNFFVIVLVGSLSMASQSSKELLGVHVVAIRIEAFSFLPGFAMGTAAATLAGQYLGAGSEKLAKLCVWRCNLVAVAIMAIFGMAFIFFPEPIVGLISPQPAHIEQTPDLLRICGLVQIPFALAIVFRAALRGAGDVRVVMAITWLCTYGIRIPLAFLFSGADLMIRTGSGESITLLQNPSPLHLGLTGLWIGLCSEIVLRAVFFTTRYLHGGWMRVRV
ncbi:MAG: MATE family efflux transporter [Phycisphaerales bacterium]